MNKVTIYTSANRVEERTRASHRRPLIIQRMFTASRSLTVNLSLEKLMI
jgi:hypothetical protein